MDTGLSGDIGSYAADHGFKASYIGTLQKGSAESILIPCDARKVAIPVSRIVGVINSAQSGCAVLINVYRDGVLIDTATLAVGTTSIRYNITPTVIEADEVITFTVDWTGTPTELGITLTMRLE